MRNPGYGVALAGLALAVLAMPVDAAVRAELERSRVAVGEPVMLRISVSDASGSVGDPSFDIQPRGVDVQSAGTERQMSWVNGRTSNQIITTYQLVATRAGRYQIVDLRVPVGKEAWAAPPLELVVEAGVAPASLRMDLSPAEPWAGQPAQLRLRLIEHQPVEDWTPYAPEDLTGFWAEPEGRRQITRVTPSSPLRVVETRRRLYPLAAGHFVIGSATVMLTLPEGAREGARTVSIESGPLPVRVRPLPPAPRDFGGAVGTLEARWSADRERTPLDLPLTLTLDLRGVANLPLLHAPPLDPPGWEVLPGAVEDSLATAGTDGAARRRFHWTLVPRRAGTQAIPLPDLVWFDPGSGSYRRAAFLPLSIRVDPASGTTPGDESGFPAVFSAAPLQPFGRGWRPWAAALAGLLLGLAASLWRRGGAPDARAIARRERDAQLALLERPGGDFWGAALDAAGWLEAHGRPQPGVRAEIERARYGSDRAEAQPLRSKLRAELASALPAGPGRIPPRWTAAALVLAAVGCGWLALPAGDASGASLARLGDDRARAGDLVSARDVWRNLWERGARAPGLAARLGWCELRAGSLGRAAAWVLRGAPGEARDPALLWLWDRVREGGGLLGAHAPRPPLRSLELALAGFVLAAAAGWWISWRPAAAALLAAALVAALALPLRGALWSRSPRGVVLESTRLAEQNLELGAGQVVSVTARAPGRARVSVGAEGEGWLPQSVVEEVR